MTSLLHRSVVVQPLQGYNCNVSQVKAAVLVGITKSVRIGLAAAQLVPFIRAHIHYRRRAGAGIIGQWVICKSVILWQVQRRALSGIAIFV